MRVKKLISLAMTLIMIVCLSVSVAGVSVYAADAGCVEDFESYEENALPNNFKSFSAYAEGDAKIKNDATSGIGKHLNIAPSDGASNLGMGIDNNLDLTAADAIIAYEFDFKATSNAYLTIARLYSDVNFTTQMGLIATDAAGQIQLAGSTTTTKLDLNKWNHFKVIFYTKTRECELFYNDAYITKAEYTVPATPFIPIRLFLNLSGTEFGLDNIKMYETTAPSKDEYGYKETFENHTMGAAPNGLTTFSAYATGDAEIKNDATSGIGQYMNLKTTDGSTNMGLDISTTLNLGDADKVIAFEFDYKTAASSTATIACFLDVNNARATLLGTENGQIKYDTVYSGKFITPNEWNHFKIVLYTKTHTYDVFYNGTFLANANYTGSFVPKKLFFATNSEFGLDNIKIYETTAPSKAEYGYKDDFEGTTDIAGFYKNSTTGENDVLIQNDATEGIGKYLEYKRDNWSGDAAGFKVGKPVNTNVDLYAEDAVVAMEFDCLKTGVLTKQNINLAANGYTYQMAGLYFEKDGFITAWDSDSGKFISTGVKVTTNKWNHFKVVYYTKAREYEIYYNNSSMPLVRAKYDYPGVSEFKPTSFYVSMYSYDAAADGQPFSESLGIDNIKIYETDKPEIEFGRILVYKDYDHDNGCGDNNITASGLVAGAITAELSVINRSTEDVPVTLVAALFKGNVLDKISIASSDVATNAVPEMIATAALDVPEGDLTGYKLRTYVLESMGTLKPLRSFSEFTPAS